jgi:hypothetical protein
MTFLLFLASIAVLEYLVRETGQKSKGVKSPSIGLGQVIHPDPPAAETATSDLLALGRALNVQKQAHSAEFEGVASEMKSESELTKL